MGKKKQGITILRGSLKMHWVRYLTSIDMQVNPVDQRAHSILHRTIHTLNHLDSKFIQPGFKFNYAFVDKGYYHQSIMHAIWVNGYERKYQIGLMDWSTIEEEIKEINYVTEYERNMLGQDDELDDDA